MPTPGFGRWDPGGCNCPCACYPVALPETNLFVTYANGCSVIKVPLYLQTSRCTWETFTYAVPASLCTFGGDQNFKVTCLAGCSSYQVGAGVGTPITNHYDYPAGCAIAGTNSLALVSFTASPLTVVFWNPSNHPFTWTITDV